MTRKMFVGKKVRIHVKVEDYNGEDRAGVERILPWDPKSQAGGPPAAKAAPKQVQATPADEDEALPDDELDAVNDMPPEEDLPF